MNQNRRVRSLERAPCIALLTLACATTSAREVTEAPAPRVEAVATVSAAHEAPRAPTYAELAVPGFLPALVFAPELAAQRLMVATHGAGGLPEWECEYWRALTHSTTALLCLRGKALSNAAPSGFYYPDHHALERELLAALDVFGRPFGHGVYVGFSQGAIMGAAMIPAHAARFPRLVLVEGGYEYWSAASAQKFARNGGERVLFVCGTKWCNEHCVKPRQWLTKAGVGVRVEYARGAGHTPEGAVRERVAAALPWLLAD